MNKAFPGESLLSNRAQKRFGKPNGLGRMICGVSNLGTEAEGIIFEPLGVGILGQMTLGNYFLLSGVYQIRECEGGKKSFRTDFYNYKITHTPGQQTIREKYGAGVGAWKVLPEPEKEIYRQRAIGKHMSGYNLFQKEYIKS